jgi:hypothetical protein
MITYSPFMRELQAVVRAHTPKPIAHVGDIVMTTWGGEWKKPNRVRITSIYAHPYPKNCGESDREGYTFCAGVDLWFSAKRVDAAGEFIPKSAHIAMREFTTLDGKVWKNSVHVGTDISIGFTLEEEPQCD